jgi:hypothetical protein
VPRDGLTHGRQIELKAIIPQGHADELGARDLCQQAIHRKPRLGRQDHPTRPTQGQRQDLQ